MITEDTETRTRRYRGLAYTRPIDAAKEAIQVIDLADRLCGPGVLRRVGKEWVGRCPLPEHEDRSPSFTVNPEKNVFFCHGCLRGGDVVELARLAWGYDQRDAHAAAAMLLMEFGHDVPKRPPAWFRKQERQAPVRQALEDATIRRLQRRLFPMFMPLLESIQDDARRREEIELVWDDLREVAVLVLARRST